MKTKTKKHQTPSLSARNAKQARSRRLNGDWMAGMQAFNRRRSGLL